MCEITNPMTEEVMSYKCNWCNKIYKRQFDADECAFNHARINLANTLLNEGTTLASIEYWCGFHWNLTEEQKNITKDSCFIISHWQCCEKPAYKIVAIEGRGCLRIWGIGGWSGGYGNTISLDRLPKPHSKEEFYSYK